MSGEIIGFNPQALRDYARWIREAQTEQPNAISIFDMDSELLDAAAAEIDQLRAEIERLVA